MTSDSVSLLTWQLVDSAFPTGAFAHSWGLEAAWQHGEIPDLDALRAFVDQSIVQAGFASLPLLNAAFHAPERLEALDELADAFLINPVANRASRIQGRTMIATASRIWPSAATTDLRARADRTCAHLAPFSGAVFAAIDLPLTTAQTLVLYSAARGVLSAAVRLGVVGSYEAQRMQTASGASIQRVARACAVLTEDDLTQTAPLLDLWQSGHDRLYSRLFQS
jgi:urease accessory protein